MMDDHTTPNDRNDAIRARAHEIWETEGRPEGHEADHWARAEAELFGPATGGSATDSSAAAESTPAESASDPDSASEMLGQNELGAAPSEKPAPAPKARKPRRKAAGS
ncbi:DUF2934 domain-containing protein [Paracoccus nototheniae]|uniref:DUF2934 domain-containing protein n=1 Tax=Paracoccus nototheniae TaxID=2489002 RepID=A0ABW4DW52_9RHOB|nr:DUF2934 domain-containing protein [Paracoccus nototheniae]